MAVRDGVAATLARVCVYVALFVGTCEAGARAHDLRPPSTPEVTSLCERGRELSKAVAKPAFEINGARINDLESFYDEVEKALIPDAVWGRNLNAFNDILRGGFGTPDGGFVLVWKHHKLSRERLGRQYTLRSMKQMLGSPYAESVAFAREKIIELRSGGGTTEFERLVEIIRIHGPGGEEETDGVFLVLC